MWLLHLTCKEYHLNPADEFGLQDRWVRWQFNHAVATAGRIIEGKLNEKDEKNRNKYSLEEVLGLPVKPVQNISGKMFGNG